MIGMKRGLFGRKPMTGATMGGFGGGTFNMDGTPVDEPEPHNYAQTEAPQGKGLFGGGTVRAIAGTIGDTLLQHNDMAPVYAPTMLAQQQHAAKQREASLRAEAENAQWYEREEWKRKNAPAKDPYRWRNNDGDLMELGADGQPRKAYDDPTEKIDWIQVKDPVSGAISIIPRPRGGGMGDAPDVLPPDFDFGGGGASNGTSGFREAFAEWN